MSYLRKIEYKIIPEKSYEVIHNCSGCGSKARFVNTGRFRVNANGNKLDVWLIYQCEKCKHTLNLSIYERTDRKKVPPEEYGLFLQNDETLAETYGMDYTFFGRNRAEVDWLSMTWRMEKVADGNQEVMRTEYQSGDVIVVHNPHGVKVRTEKIVGQILETSRSVVKKLIDTKEIVVEQKGTDVEIIIPELKKICIERIHHSRENALHFRQQKKETYPCNEDQYTSNCCHAFKGRALVIVCTQGRNG